MPNPLFDRHNPSDCGAVISEFVPQRHRHAVFSALVRSIRDAHTADPAKWGLRLNTDSVMLKVGFNEVWQCGRDWVRVLVSREKLPRGITADIKEPYRHAPGCDSIGMRHAALPKTIMSIQPAHSAAIQISAKSQRHTTTDRDHSPGLVTFLARETRSRLQQPHYSDSSANPRDTNFEEGEPFQILMRGYERDKRAVLACLRHFGARCVVCGFSFADWYGAKAATRIHVHHLTPLADIGERYVPDPIRDLRPVCPNCHVGIHTTNPPRTIKEMKRIHGIKNRDNRKEAHARAVDSPRKPNNNSGLNQKIRKPTTRSSRRKPG